MKYGNESNHLKEGGRENAGESLSCQNATVAEEQDEGMQVGGNLSSSVFSCIKGKPLGPAWVKMVSNNIRKSHGEFGRSI